MRKKEREREIQTERNELMLKEKERNILNEMKTDDKTTIRLPA